MEIRFVRKIEVKGFKHTDTSVIVGVVCHPGSGLWQTWISLDGNDVIQMTAHISIIDASETLDEFKIAYGEGKLASDDRASRYIDSMLTDAFPELLPEASLVEIGAAIDSLKM
ncbi:MAG: hypothetical protein WA584_23525 [Pyrinomonadaceae bacterium]